MPGDIHLDRLSVAEKVQLLERVCDSLLTCRVSSDQSLLENGPFGVS